MTTTDRSRTHRASWVRAVAALLLAVALATGYVPSPAIEARSAGPDCGFVLGFDALRSGIISSEGEDLVGPCREDEYHALSGDGVQWTEKGLFIWRKATNWAGFTNGESTWVQGPSGVARRSGNEQLEWEDTGRPDPVSYLHNPSPTRPPASETDEVIRHVYVLHTANGGSTYSMYFGDMAGRKLYAVSLFPDRSVLVGGTVVGPDALRAFVDGNRDLLVDPRVSVGTWFNTDDGVSFLDISATIPDREQAIELGKRYNQISIFDLWTFEEIETGGTGEPVQDLPPPDKRLSELAGGDRPAAR
jgi:hypothetical protein